MHLVENHSAHNFAVATVRDTTADTCHGAVSVSYSSISQIMVVCT